MENKKVEINLGLVCNCLCKFCINDTPPRKRKFIPFEIVRKELAFYYRKGYRALGLLGGEPTIYPDIAEVISLADRLGYAQIHIVSNGRKYSDKKFLERLIKSGVTRFYVSIHSHKPEIEDYLTSVRGSFREKIRGLDNLRYFKEKGMIRDDVLLNTVINQFNYRYLREITAFFYDRGFSNFRFNFIRPQGRALSGGRLIVPEYERIMPYVREVIASAKSLKINLTFEAIPFCLFRKFKIKNFMRHIGELKDAQTEVSFGQSKTRNRFMVSQRRKSRLKAKIAACCCCIFDPFCEGPWKDYMKIYDF